MADFWKRSGLFDEDRSGFAFREVFTPTREGPLPPRLKPHPSGRGGSLYDKAVAPPVTASVWSAADAAANAMTLSNGGLTVTPSGAGSWQSIRSSISHTTGLVYVEILANGGSINFNDVMVGLASASLNIATFLGNSVYSVGMTNGINYVSAGFTSNITSSVFAADGDVFAMAVDFGTGSIWIAKNNSWLGGGTPVTAKSLPVVSFVPATVGALFVGLTFLGTQGTWTLQPTAASQKYAPPSGFSPWG